MSPDRPQSHTERMRLFEEQVVQLYGRSQFLREDEIAYLRQSARALDKHVACLTLVNGEYSGLSGRPLGTRTLRKLIERFRGLQAKREPDSRQLARIRESALAFRKSRIRQNWFRRFLRSYDSRQQRLKEKKLRDESLNLDLVMASLRQQAAINLMCLVVADTFSSEQNRDGFPPSGREAENVSAPDISEALQILKSVRHLRKKKAVLREMFVNMKVDRRVLLIRGEQCQR